jgi:calmodulin-lysine N-methyltransferase
MFAGKKVVELGGGMTAMAGIIVAQCTSATSLLLTDGNESSVDNLNAIVGINKLANVSASVLRWNEPLPSDLEGAFDFVICADCLFFDEFRKGGSGGGRLFLQIT